jgi:hypothetical protein
MKVCLFADHKYNDNNGAFTVFTLFDTKTKQFSTEGGIYSDLAFDHYEPTSDLDVIFDASNRCNPTPQNGVYNKYASRYHYTGCIVSLKRSRKAPNNTPLEVIGDRDGGYNSFYNNYQPDEILVKLDNGDQVWVSAGCINEILKGVLVFPLWHITENEYKNKRFNCKNRKNVNNDKRLTFADNITLNEVKNAFSHLTEDQKADSLKIMLEHFPKIANHL